MTDTELLLTRAGHSRIVRLNEDIRNHMNELIDEEKNLVERERLVALKESGQYQPPKISKKELLLVHGIGRILVFAVSEFLEEKGLEVVE